jgi:uncharacterized membrane protein YbhN (UPF0104 family)
VGTTARASRVRSSIRLFASTSEEPRARRPTDALLLGLGAVALGSMALLHESTAAAEGDVAALVDHLPAVLETAWQLLHDLGALWAVGLLLLASAANRRLPLARDLLLAGALAAMASMVVQRLVEGSWPSILDELTASGGPPLFPAVRLSIVAAVIITASPHLARPLRYSGRWILAGDAMASIALGLATPGGVLGAVVLGSMSAATVHLLFGSPGGRPSLWQVADALAELGVPAADLQPADLQPEGVWTVVATDPSGDHLVVKIYGRDAWDGQLAMSVWRFLWYRNTVPAVSLNRVQLVEHEAFLMLLAASVGIRVPSVLAAGRTEAGDALLVLRTDATVLDTILNPSDELLHGLWASLGQAHRAGLSPGQLDPLRLGCDHAGEAVVLDWVAGRTAPSVDQQLQDEAQLLVATALVAGDDRAVTAAERAVGQDRMTELLPYVQSASLSPTLRSLARDRDHDVEALRSNAADRIGGEVPELVRLRRVTVGTVVQAALLLLAATAIVDGLSGLDYAAVGDELRALAWGAVAIGFVLTQTARASGAMSTIGASPQPLPLGPVVLLQFAIGYINMAVPSSAGRLAMVMRFYQRVGSTAATALGVGALDSLANFLIQVLLVVVTLGFGLGTIELDLTSAIDELSPEAVRLIVLGGAILVVAAAVSMLLPSVRERILPTARQFRAGLRVLRSPSKVALLIGGNLLTQVFYAFALGACVQAAGHDVGLADLLLIINLVGTLASMIPVPNGIGVSEAGLTAGLVAAGVPSEAAFAAVITYRILSAYLPPIWGFFAMRSLQRQHYL